MRKNRYRRKRTHPDQQGVGGKLPKILENVTFCIFCWTRIIAFAAVLGGAHVRLVGSASFLELWVGVVRVLLLVFVLESVAVGARDSSVATLTLLLARALSGNAQITLLLVALRCLAFDWYGKGADHLNAIRITVRHRKMQEL